MQTTGSKLISPNSVPFKISDDGFYLDGRLTTIVDGSCYDFMGRKIFTTGFFRNNIGFGITNIDIEINQSMQPIVTITFKDLYGNVVFGKKNIDREVPDYSVLFNWPPPKFLFTFKGYLGKQVSWMLNLKKTSTNYQQDGSYDIKCEFVPNQWGFFGDLPFLFLLAVKGLKRREMPDTKFKKVQTIFDLIKIGKKIEVKTKEVSREFDNLLQQMTLIKSGRIVEGLCYSGILKLGETIDGTAGRLKIKGTSEKKFQSVTIKAPTDYNTIDKIKNYSSTSAEALRKMNTFLFLNASIGGASSAGVSTVDAVNFDSGGYKEDKSRERSTVISNNISLIEDAIKARAYSSSKTQLRKVTIGEVFKQLTQDSGYIMGKILEAGSKGLENNPGRVLAAKSHEIIGTNFPLEIEDNTGDEIPCKRYGVEENEMAFINEFVSAISEGVALDLVQNDQASGTQDELKLIKRINNVEAPQGNPYRPFFRNIAQNIMIRSGIIAFLTRSNDPNLPGDYDTFWGIDRTSVEEVLELAAADMENISENLLSQLTSDEYIKLRQFCNYWTRLMTEDGLYYLDSNGDKAGAIPTNGFRESISSSLLNRDVIVDKAANIKKDLKTIYAETFGSKQGSNNEDGDVIDNSSAKYINEKSMQSQAVYNNGILYRVPKTAIEIDTSSSTSATTNSDFLDDFSFVLFEGFYATYAKEARNAVSDDRLSSEDLDKALLGIVPIDTYYPSESLAPTTGMSTTGSTSGTTSTTVLDPFSMQPISLGGELGRVALTNKRFQVAVLNFNEMANPGSDTWKNEEKWLSNVVYDKRSKIVDPNTYTGNNHEVFLSNLAVSIAFSPLSQDKGLVFGPFMETTSGRNHRSCIKKMCSILLEKMGTLEENRNKVISNVIGKAEEGKTALYKQFHTLFHQWQVLMYDDPTSDNLCSDSNQIKSNQIVSVLENRYGGENADSRHVSIQKEDRKTKIQNLDSNVFVYDCVVSDVADIDVRNSLINIGPMYNPDGNTTVLNMIQQICAKNNFSFIPIPGNGNFSDYSEVFTPHRSTPQKIQNLFYVLFNPTPESRTTLSNTSNVVLSQAKTPVLNTDAFEVKVGSTENKIFKSVTIDSAENKPTAESVITLQTLTDKDNTNNQMGVDCSTLPVMEGKSYMAGFSMVGNAQIFPMQYFYLNSIPLFNGLYQIRKVRHSITPNSMSTNAEGIRMRVNLGGTAAMRPITLETFENLDLKIESLDSSDLENRKDIQRTKPQSPPVFSFGLFQRAVNASTIVANVSGSGQIAQGDDADFWALIALCSMEAGAGQSRADVAQSIYNRLGCKKYSNSESIKSIVCSNGQYEPTFKNKPQWNAINDKQSALIAVMNSKGVTQSTAEKMLKDTYEGITNIAYRTAAKDFIQGRTDFQAQSQGTVEVKNKKTNSGPFDPTGKRVSFVQRIPGNNVFGFAYNYQDNVVYDMPNFDNWVNKYASFFP